MSDFRPRRFGCSGPRDLPSADQDWARLSDHFEILISHTRHDNDASNNRKCRSVREADVLSVRYCYPAVHVNGSDLCATCTVGTTPMRITNIDRLLGGAPPETRTAHESTCRFPYETVEMIIAHIAHDRDALKACSLTCYSWYTAAIPHIHHTLTLVDDMPGITCGGLKPLPKLHQLGLTPLVKEIRVDQWGSKWFVPRAFSDRDLSHFSAFTNVQTLRLQDPQISNFIPAIERYFGHFSPTLRSIALSAPSCTPQELSHFLSLFPNLDNIKISGMAKYPPDVTTPNPQLVSISTPRLRGRLVLHNFGLVETLTRLVASGGGPRFHYMELYRVVDCAPVLFEACAETVETLRFSAGGQ